MELRQFGRNGSQEIEYSLISRGIEDSILPTCREFGIGITAYGILARSLISGHWQAARTPGDFRVHSPRFQKGNVEQNLAPVETLRESAKARNTTVAQLVIAWLHYGGGHRAAGRSTQARPAFRNAGRV